MNLKQNHNSKRFLECLVIVWVTGPISHRDEDMGKGAGEHVWTELAWQVGNLDSVSQGVRRFATHSWIPGFQARNNSQCTLAQYHE